MKIRIWMFHFALISLNHQPLKPYPSVLMDCYIHNSCLHFFFFFFKDNPSTFFSCVLSNGNYLNSKGSVERINAAL